jgi:SAM-dependent methyltransferase
MSGQLSMMLETLSKCNICSSQNLKAVDAQHNLCQCSNCKYIFDNPRPTPSEIVSFYSRPVQYEDWLSEISDRDRLWQRRLRKLKQANSSGTLLDIGSGIGQFLHHANLYYTQVSGTEVSDTAIDIAKKKYGLNLIKGSIEDINFESRKFDNITMFHVLEHVHDPKSVIRICHSLLNENGLLFIAVPNEINCWKSKLSFVKKIKYELINKPKASNIHNNNQISIGKWGLPKLLLDGSLTEIHLSHFTPNTLQCFLEKTGFKVLENSLDPVLNSTFKVNYYDTIWIVARKVDLLIGD